MTVYSLGWTVFRAHVGRTVSADRRRRMVVVGILTALATAIALVLAGVLTSWPDLGSTSADVGVALAAVAAGLFATALVPLRPRTAEGGRMYWSGSQMAAPEHIERYFRSRVAPTIAPRDRDEVLRDADAVRAGMVPEVLRGIIVVAFAVLAFVAMLLLDFSSYVVVWLVLFTSVRTVMSVLRLGRVERARALAETLPDVPPVPDRPSRRHPSPNGSKIRLPGD